MYEVSEPNWKKLSTIYEFIEDGKMKFHTIRDYGFFFDSDRKFRNLYAQIHGVTRMPPERAWGLYQLAAMIKNVPGNIMEVGVFRGGTAKFLTLLLGLERQFFFYDTWEGIPVVAEKHDAPVLLGQFENTSLEKTKEFVGDHPHYHFIKGIFPKTFILSKFAFVHIDVDTYETTMAALNTVYELMETGGVIVVDDFGKLYKGVKEAALEFFSRRIETPISLIPEQGFVVKL
jgi:hypothetical protein